MRKSLLLSATIALLTGWVSAYAAYTPFNTIAQAEQYCPPLDGLTFTAQNPFPYSEGKIAGNKNNVNFNNDGYDAIHPKYINAAGVIQDLQFRQAANTGIYGYISDNAITCLYSYETFTGTPFALIMRGF